MKIKKLAQRAIKQKHKFCGWTKIASLDRFFGRKQKRQDSKSCRGRLGVALQQKANFKGGPVIVFFVVGRYLFDGLI